MSHQESAVKSATRSTSDTFAGVERRKCPVCLGRGNVAYGDHTLHRCRLCVGLGYVVHEREVTA
jgi:DnaJ-class molecular chaperone